MGFLYWICQSGAPFCSFVCPDISMYTIMAWYPGENNAVIFGKCVHFVLEFYDEQSWWFLVLWCKEDWFGVCADDEFGQFLVNYNVHCSVNCCDFCIIDWWFSWETFLQFLVLEDSNINYFNSLIRPICIDKMMIWQVIWDDKEFLLRCDGVCFGFG